MNKLTLAEQAGNDSRKRKNREKKKREKHIKIFFWILCVLISFFPLFYAYVYDSMAITKRYQNVIESIMRNGELIWIGLVILTTAVLDAGCKDIIKKHINTVKGICIVAAVILLIWGNSIYLAGMGRETFINANYVSIIVVVMCVILSGILFKLHVED